MTHLPTVPSGDDIEAAIEAGDPRVIFAENGPSADPENGLLVFPAGTTPDSVLWSKPEARWYQWTLIPDAQIGEDDNGDPILADTYVWAYRPAIPSFQAVGSANADDSSPLAAGANDETGTPISWYNAERPGVWTNGSGNGEATSGPYLEILQQGMFELEIGIRDIVGGNQNDYVAVFLEAADTDDLPTDDPTWYSTTANARYLGNVRRVGDKIGGTAGTFRANHAGEEIFDGTGGHLGNHGKVRVSLRYVTTDAGGVTGDAQFRVRRISPSAGF